VNDFLSVLRPGTTIIESIYEFLSLLCGEEAIAELFERIDIKRAKAVVDTNVFLSDLRYYIQKGHHTGLMAAAKFGGMRIFASTTVRDEVPEKIAVSLSKYGIDAQEARQIWETYYVPWISFLDPSELPPLSARVTALLARDPDDVPTGQIIELIGPHLVLTRDKDLIKFESTGQDIPIITCAYRDKTKQETVALCICVSGGFVFSISLETIKSLVAFICGLDKRLSIGFLILAAGSFIAALIYPPSRRWLWKQGRQTIENLWRVFGPLLDELLEIEAASARAKPVLSQSRRVIAPPKTARDYAVLVLSESFGPLRAKEIVRRMIALGYQTSSEHPEYYVSRVLHKYPRLFEMTEGKRWRLKSHTPNISEQTA